MHFEKDYIYHIYNRSNEQIFKEESNYLYFIEKIRKHILPFADILAYCLMPNHFHLMVQVNAKGVKLVNEKHRIATQLLSKNIGLLLSSYTQAINKQENRKGSLFAHKTKSKQLNNFGNFNNINQINYSLVCFNYIHQNPLNSGLVHKISDWDYSSYKDYVGLRNGTIINKELAIEILNLDFSNFIVNSKIEFKEEIINNIF